MSEITMNYGTMSIAEMTNGIILAKYEREKRVSEKYQTESELEEKFIKDLILQGYERLNVSTSEELYKNLRIQIEKLNKIEFTDSEWSRFLIEYLELEK